MTGNCNDVWDRDADASSTSESSLTRRRLLGVAGGGFALAASGLVLSAWLAEAEAREGALGGAMGGRHGKNHRGRDTRKRRTHGDKNAKQKDQDRPRGGPFKTHPIKFLVDLYGEHSPIKADLYSTRLRPGQGDSWELRESESVAPSAGKSFAATDTSSALIKAALWLDDRILVEASARVPSLRIGHGGDFSAGGRGWQGGTVVFDDGMEVNDLTQRFEMEGFRLRVERLADDGDFFQYHVLVNPGF